MGLFVAEDDAFGVIMDPAERDEPAPFQLHVVAGVAQRSSWNGETLRVVIDRCLGVLTQNAFLAPFFQRVSSTAIDVILVVILGFGFAQNDPYQVIRAGGVIGVLHGGCDFVVGLGHH